MSRALQLDVVLDDPVQHHREAVVAARQWVRVLLGGAPVRGPARVADARRRVRVDELADGAQLGQVADGTDQLDVLPSTSDSPAES